MTVTCPEGHQSEATDYCDICGTPIGGSDGSGPGGAGAAGPSGAPGSTPGPVIPQAGPGSVLDLDPAPAAVPTLTCPHCGGLNVADALFCEACGYDFTTGAAPLGSEPVVPEPDASAASSALDLGGDPAAGTGEDVGATEDEDAEGPDQDAGVTDEDAEGPDQDAAAQHEAEADADAPTDAEAGDEPAQGPDEPAQGPDEPAAEDGKDEVAVAAAEPEGSRGDSGREHLDGATSDPDPVTSPDPSGAAAHVRPRHTPPSRALSDTWVVEVWIDPDWYAVQQTEEACPSPGLPDIVVVRRNVALIGRPSGSLGVRPDVDAGADSAVSRRHAQLTSDGSRWWIEDLGSSNGTYVGSVGEPLPTQPIRQRVEIDRDDRIYVGAWTRLVLRQATTSEQAGQG
ncbi:FHA domain-containing protein [Ornithinimicrobium sufpigmenti]|uniref:FHA domain-containing protein n=1 Tax=Ornithinimicrobium sufpigmenti TaxID=2508882 RepID=UPI0010368DF4|nr:MULTISPECIES: FHA domain-containing protein [unclassified Ornithinimicrobium]